MGELEVRPGTGTEIGPYADTGGLMRAMAAQMEAAGKTSQLFVWSDTHARAYVYCGEWVADCPSSCGNTQWLTDKPLPLRGVAGQPGMRREAFCCDYCHHLAPGIRWPEHADDIAEILDRRPIPHTRNWYPEGHLTAIKAGIPDGQTCEDLLAENAAHGVA